MSNARSVRKATRADAPAVKLLSDEAGLSDGDDDFALEPMDDDHTWIVREDPDGVIVGAAYFGPESHSDRVWNLYFLAVANQQQGGGIGSELVSYIESDLRRRGEDLAKLLLIETSSVDSFQPTRAFYTKCGYIEVARIREYYGLDDDKVVFWKRLTDS